MGVELLKLLENLLQAPVPVRLPTSSGSQAGPPMALVLVVRGHALREHYARTLRSWVANLGANGPLRSA